MRTTMSSGRNPKTSATVCAITVPMPVPMSCTPDKTSIAPSRLTRTSQDERVWTLAPHNDWATPRPRLTGPGSAPAARRRSQPNRSAPSRRSSRRTGLGSMRSRSASGSMPRRSASSSIACSIANAPGVLPGPRIAHPGPALMKTSYCGGLEVGAGVEALREIADAAADRHAGGAIALQRDRRQRSVAARADAQTLPGFRPVAGVHLFLAPFEADAHRRPGLSRQRDRDASVDAERRLRAEAAAHAVDDDAHAFERQAELLRQLLADPGGELGRHIDGEAVRRPIGDDRVRLEAAMGLRLRAVFALDDDFGVREALRGVASAGGRGTAHVAFDRQARRRRPARGMAVGRGGFVVNDRGVRRSGRIHVDDERQRLVVDPDQRHRLLRRGHRSRGDRGDRRADIAHDAGYGDLPAGRSPLRRGRRDGARRRSDRGREFSRAATASAGFGHRACRAGRYRR